MAHEYLDLRFGRVKGFVSTGVAAVEDLALAARRWILDQPTPDTGPNDPA
jgi:hypothetical protein